jgi:phosphohistidine phosphatase SixA
MERGESAMQLYLVQHGTAKSEAEDPQRSLTEEERVVRLDRDATGQWVCAVDADA